MVWVQPRKSPCVEHPGTPTRTVQQRTFCLVCESRRKQTYRDWQWLYRYYLQRCDLQLLENTRVPNG